MSPPLIRAADVATTAGAVFATCATQTVDALALAQSGVKYANHWEDGYEWRFPDGSLLLVRGGAVVYGQRLRNYSTPYKCECCGITTDLWADMGSGGPWRCGSSDCLVY